MEKRRSLGEGPLSTSCFGHSLLLSIFHPSGVEQAWRLDGIRSFSRVQVGIINIRYGFNALGSYNSYLLLSELYMIRFSFFFVYVVVVGI